MSGKRSKSSKELKQSLLQNMSTAPIPEVETKPVLPCRVEPIIALSNKAVAVNGRRQVIVLRANKNSTGKGILTCAGHEGKIKLYQNGTELALSDGKAEFNIISTAGVTLHIEAIEFSDVDAISFHWELQPSSEETGAPVTQTMTSVKATLDIFKKSDTALSVQEKLGDGRTIHLQNTDKKMSRAKVTLKCEPASYVDELILESVNDKLKLFDAAKDGSEKQPLPLSFPVGPGKNLAPLYVEGAKVSDSRVDSGLKLRIKGLDDAVDGSKITVLEVKLAICDDTKSPLSAVHKTNPGRLLLKQTDKFTSLRAKLSVLKKPVDTACSLKLKAANAKVKLFPEANEKHVDLETAETLPKTIGPTDITSASDGMVFWAEGSELTSLGESTFQIDVDGVDEECDKILISVAELKNGDESDIAPWLIPVENLITKPVNNHIAKIKLVHNFGEGDYEWKSASTKVTLADETTQTVQLTAKKTPSATAKAESLDIEFTPSGKNKFPPVKHKFGVVEIKFAKNSTHTGGYDEYADLACIRQNGSTYTVTPTDKYDFVSVEKSTEGKVDVEFKGAEPAEIFFTSDGTGIAEPKVEAAESNSPYTLAITAKAKDKDGTVFNARVMSKTGPIVAKLGIVVLKKVAYEAELFRVQDGNNNATNVTHAITGASITNDLKPSFSSGIATLTVTGGASVTNANYDTDTGCTQNGSLDMEPGTTSVEQAKIIAACSSTKKKIIYVRDLRWSYYLRADAANGATVLKFKTSYQTAYIGYIGAGNHYTIADSDGNQEWVKVISVDKINKEITIDAPGLTRAFATAKKAALIWPLGGLSGDPAWVQDSPTSREVIEVIGHELGHELAGFKDICEKANLMYGVNSRTSTRLRHRPIDKLYGGGTEQQWLTMKGR